MNTANAVSPCPRSGPRYATIRNVVAALHDSPNIGAELLIRVLLLTIVGFMNRKIQPYMRVISPAELEYYKRPRRSSYVPVWLLAAIIIFAPLLIFCIHVRVTRNYVDCAQSFLAWTLALSITAVITETVKLWTGRFRPDFFYRCFPDGQMTKELECIEMTRHLVEGRKSFPSGHSSFSFCSMGFLSLLLCGRMGGTSAMHGRRAAAVCGTPLLVAALVAASRWADNHHHFVDVLVGGLLGLASSFACYDLYYHPLNSDLAGQPYAMTANGQPLTTDSSETCTQTTKSVRRNSE